MNRIWYGIGSVIVFLSVAGLLIGGAAAMGAMTGLFTTVDNTEAPNYDAEELYIDQLPANGTVDVEPGGFDQQGLVLIDTTHRNAIDETALEELRAALVAYGHDVRVLDDPLKYEEQLEAADALIVIEPRRAYDNETGQAVQEFVEDDGRVLLMAEPDQAIFDGQSLTPVESDINSLANRLGVSFGGDHLYDMELNDGNHRNVIVSPTDNEMMRDMDRGVVYIATHVSAVEGEPLLQTAPSARRAVGESQGQYTVAIRQENVLAIGDTTFLEPDRFNVADNEQLIAILVQFLGGEDS